MIYRHWYYTIPIFKCMHDEAIYDNRLNKWVVFVVEEFAVELKYNTYFIFIKYDNYELMTLNIF